jgi:hypothetical protein
MASVQASQFFKWMAYGLSLCVFVMPATPAHPQSSDDDLPVLYGIRLDDARVAIEVVSFGCTDASYFSVQLESASSDAYHLSILQNRRDRCRMSAHIVTLWLEIPAVSDLGATKFMLVNRLAAPGTLLRSEL